ncbi:hypothetical protein HK103_000611 [Boothiomyces macroporosus]|uniref:NAD-dependent epimerase/dehydratase domain-containing protein n=1 Tax=Boothiomyces macroporosus TaxID=261099 RepID=A0AAD5UKE3_9FUNG|nr:hypothetical protein HK103_000611 [Boothiomyces macroporosus]
MSLNVLVLGGVGFIGRNFVAYLIENNLVNSVRVVDKVLPATAYLSAEHKKIFADSRVEFKQANLVNAEKVFSREDGKQFDIVFNLAAETKYGQAEEVYDEKVYQLSVTVAKEAAKRKIRAFVEVSTGQVYEAGKKPSAEDGKIKPWTLIAKAKAKAEEEITKIPGLNLIIIRPAIVYGPFDILGITPRLIIGAVYSHLKEEMKFLWTKDLKINTVHVADVVRALWHVSATVEEKGGRVSPDIASPEIYNLADKGDTGNQSLTIDQGTVNTFIEKIFNISTGFQGTVVSQFAKLNLESITEDVNEKHLQPWSELCKAGEIANTPLTPYLDRELLKDNALSIDGSKIEKTLNFKYIHPEMTEALVRQVIDEFVQAKIWPAGTTK